MSKRFALATLLLLAGFVSAAAPDGVSMRDVTAETGIEFRHTFGDRNFSKILKATGAGTAIFDYDGDGDLDLYFVSGRYLPEICDEAGKVNEGAVNRLYRNDGPDENSGVPQFTDVTEEAGVGDTGYGMGALVGDYDNDGDTDLYVTNYGANVLYRNNGADPDSGIVTFTDVSAKAGVGGPEKLNGWTKWSTNAVFFDYDKDGWLDLWVTNYLAFDPAFSAYYGPEGFPGPRNYLGQPSLLYRNQGDGTFEDVTEKAGVQRKDGRGMGAAAGDLNGDGWPDLYEANDAMPNHLFLNQGDGTFTEAAAPSNCARGQGGENTAAMHPTLGDFDGDGWLDIFIPDVNYFSLYRNLTGVMDGDLMFDNVTVTAGIAKPCGQYTGWGSFFFDYDNDGWADLFCANGAAHRPENQQSVVLRNLGNGKFEDVSLALGKRVFFTKRLSRGAVCGDLDNDGDLDIVRVNIDLQTRGSARGQEGRPTILLNEGGSAVGNWFQVRLEGTRSNKNGIGARVAVTAGGRTVVQEMGTSPSYLSSSEARLHFGLGQAAKVAKLEIHWPSGVVQVLEDLEANRLLTVIEKGVK